MWDETKKTVKLKVRKNIERNPNYLVFHSSPHRVMISVTNSKAYSNYIANDNWPPPTTSLYLQIATIILLEQCYFSHMPKPSYIMFLDLSSIQINQLFQISRISM